MMQQLPQPRVIEEIGACLIVNKPGGLLTQAPPGIDSMEVRIKQFLNMRDDKRGKVYLGVPHRLDRPASGIMLFARNVRAASRLSTQFQNRTVKKKYWAVVEGEVSQDIGTWTDYMKKLSDRAKSEISPAGEAGSQQAILHFRVKTRDNGLTWLEIQLETGRTHQIRLQASHRGHPILGDEMYGARIAFGPQTADLRKRWIALHARSIEFEHPMTRETVRLKADPFEPWQGIEFEFADRYVEI